MLWDGTLSLCEDQFMQLCVALGKSITDVHDGKIKLKRSLKSQMIQVAE